MARRKGRGGDPGACCPVCGASCGSQMDVLSHRCDEKRARAIDATMKVDRDDHARRRTEAQRLDDGFSMMFGEDDD